MTPEITSPSTVISPTTTVISGLLHTSNEVNSSTLTSPTGTKRKSAWEGADQESETLSKSEQHKIKKQSKGIVSGVIARRTTMKPTGNLSKSQGENEGEYHQLNDQDVKRRRIDEDTKEEKRAKHSRRTKLKALMRNPEEPAKVVSALEESRREVKRLKEEMESMRKNEKAVALVLDGFEEELKCGICQESFIDPVTVQPCGHSYCGACMANYLQSYKINEKLVWTWPGHKSNLLEASYAQRRRNGESSLATKVYTTDIPRPTPPIKYNQWGEAYYSAGESDSEEEPLAAATRTADPPAYVDPNGIDEYDDSEGYSSDQEDYDASHMGNDDENEGAGGDEEGSEVDEDEGIPVDSVSVVIEVPATPSDLVVNAIEPPVVVNQATPPASGLDGQADGPVQVNLGHPPEATEEVPIPEATPSTPATGLLATPASSETVPQPATVVPGITAPEPIMEPLAAPVPFTAPAEIMPPTTPPVIQPPTTAPVPVAVKLGDGKLSSKGLSCMFCRKTPITGIVPALALGAAAELLVKVRPDTAREQEAIDDHCQKYEKGQPLSFPIPVSAIPSFTAIRKAQQDHVYMYPEAGNTRYWKPCASCKPPAAGSTRYVCPVPVPDPNHRSTRISRDMPCPGHIVCGGCERLGPEAKARFCDGCGDSRCKSCELPSLAHHYTAPTYLDALQYPARLGQTVMTNPSFINAILIPFRGNVIEASIFVAYVQNLDALAKRPGVSYHSTRYRTFSVTNMYADISSWIKNAQGKASGGLKGMFERFGEAGGLQTPEGGSGRYCYSCIRTVFKVGLAEWWTRESNKRNIKNILPASIKERAKCRWGNACFYQDNLTHAKEYTHLCARMSDEQAATLPVQAAPEADAAINVSGAAAIGPFREAFESARHAFEAARPASTVAPANATIAQPTAPIVPARIEIPPSDSEASDVDMDHAIVLHQEPEQIDNPPAQAIEGDNNNDLIVGAEPPVVAANEPDLQEEEDSLKVETAVQAVAVAAPSSLPLAIEGNATDSDADEDS